MRNLIPRVLLTLLSVSACSTSQDDSESALGAASGAPKAGDVGIQVSSSGRLTLEKGALDNRVFDLVNTVIFSNWDAKECGTQPATFKHAPPGDAPDTCFYKILPLATRLVTFSKLGEEIVMTDTADGELARFPVRARST